MIKDTTTVTTYKFISLDSKPENTKDNLDKKISIRFEPSKNAKKSLKVKQFRVIDVLDRVN